MEGELLVAIEKKKRPAKVRVDRSIECGSVGERNSSKLILLLKLYYSESFNEFGSIHRCATNMVYVLYCAYLLIQKTERTNID